MEKKLVLDAIFEKMPYLKGKLELEKVLYSQSQNKACFIFLSPLLIEESEFLKIEQFIQSLFVNAKISIRIACPHLADDFLRDIGAYKRVLESFLKRNTYAARAWINDTAWELNNNRILLTCPDEQSLEFYKSHQFDQKISAAIYDIFRIEIPVVFIVAGKREEWVESMRKMHGVLPMESSPPTERDTAATEIPKETPAKPKTPRTKKTYLPEQEVLYGSKIEGLSSPISNCTNDTGNITICGIVSNPTINKREKLILTFVLSDDTGSVYCKCFFSYGARGKAINADGSFNAEEAKKHSREAIDALAASIKPGMRLLINGNCFYDSFQNDPCVIIKSMAKMPIEITADTAEKKRVELSVHTQMSTLEATNSAADLIEYAAKLGHSAIAITDYGVVQAYPEAFSAAKKNKIKLIPGAELFMCDYELPIQKADSRSTTSSIVVLDFETTGLNTQRDRIIEIGAVKLEDGEIKASYSTLVNPGQLLDPRITEITGITDAMLQGQPSPAEATEKLLEFIGDAVIAAHNAGFDSSILYAELRRMGKTLDVPVLDTLVLARGMYPELKSYRLKSICRHLTVSLTNAHRAVHDATATAQCLNIMLKSLGDEGIHTLAELNNHMNGRSLGYSKNVNVLVQKQCGLENLYYLVSQGHTKYFKRETRVPREEIVRHREGLLLGSSCNEGELFQAIIEGADDAALEQIAGFYDFLEIQPVEQHAQYLRDAKVADNAELRAINKKILAIGDKLGIPVAATGHVHYKNPGDSVYRSIIHATVGKRNFDKQPPLYFRTTDDMLKAHAYLGEADAMRVVVDNTNAIAEQIEAIRQYPEHPDGKNAVTFQPFWENAAKNIQNCTYYRARQWYGETLPEIVQKRIDKELKSILGFGFGTLYNIAQKLVLKSNKDGYLVGSRGSVGSSFVATMCGITEVNPLPPHYRCAHCRKAYFDVPKEVSVGADLPDASCPTCGEKMIKDGYDIPFEVFLGFEGDKVPDIDLNFSGDYQAKAHAYVEELFGKGHVFRAGTISALQEKTAFGYVSKYLELKGMQASKAYKERLVSGLAGVKKTTGQHPGGMVVLPKDYRIYQFTPIQYPADDVSSKTYTTHFDFSSMHDILVKLDILGHDDPTMLYMLERLTGVSYREIPLDDKKVMSLFTSTEALGVKPEDILCKTGTQGVPEFGTEFVQGMLIETMPTTMSELLRISGLSHGTDVWLGNARDLILNKVAMLPECVCTRDDIMNALIAYGLDSKLSFDTMEAVRKGKGLTPSTEEEMRKHKVPEWFIDSCNKIKYMFPKAHATAYVVMALRIAYYKVHYPLAYYAAYFTIRSKGFNGETMLLDTDILREKIRSIIASGNMLGAKEKDELYALRMVLEMQSRGLRFLHADLYKSDAKEFLMEDGALRIPLNSLPGLGDAVAEGIIAARKEEFKTVEDLRKRAKIGKSTVDLLKKNHAIQDLPETAQMDMFSLLGL